MLGKASRGNAVAVRVVRIAASLCPSIGLSAGTRRISNELSSTPAEHRPTNTAVVGITT